MGSSKARTAISPTFRPNLDNEILVIQTVVTHPDFIRTGIWRHKTEVMMVPMHPIPVENIYPPSPWGKDLEGPPKTPIHSIIVPGKLYKSFNNVAPIEYIGERSDRARNFSYRHGVCYLLHYRDNIGGYFLI